VARLVLYYVAVCILVFGLESVTYSNVVFMEGSIRQCSLADLVLYCVTVFILVLGFECLMVSSFFVYGRKYQRVQFGRVSVILCDNMYIGIGF